MRRMARSFRLTLLLALACASPAVTRAQEQPGPMELIRKAVENEKANDKKAREYMFGERVETKKKQGNGFKTEVETREVFFLYGDQVKRLIAKDDKPLSEKDAKKEEERIAKIIEKHKNESESDRRKHEEKTQKDREEERKFLDEVAQAYDFKLEEAQNVGGRDAWVISGEPRRDFHPQSKEARILPKIRFKAWIDKEETEWVRVEAEVIDNITFGLFLAKLDKGAHFPSNRPESTTKSGYRSTSRWRPMRGFCSSTSISCPTLPIATIASSALRRRSRASSIRRLLRPRHHSPKPARCRRNCRLEASATRYNQGLRNRRNCAL